MVTYTIIDLCQHVRVKLAMCRYAVKLPVKVKLAQYFALVN